MISDNNIDVNAKDVVDTKKNIKKTTRKTKKTQNFDDAMLELESIVEKMEKEDLPLEESLKLYKEASKLANICKEKLTLIEGEILIIQNEMNSWQENIFRDMED